MAYAMMGGIIVGTLLTLLFLPALYVAWFRIYPDPSDQQPAHGKAIADHPPAERSPAHNASAQVREPQF
jgi:hypothetical protein